MNAGEEREGCRNRREKYLQKKKKYSYGQGRAFEQWVKVVWPEEWRDFTAGRQKKSG